MALTYITFQELIEDTRHLVQELPAEIRRELVGVLGVPRSGIFPAAVIATHLHLPLSDFWSFIRAGQAFSESGNRLLTSFGGNVHGRRILVVDDSCYRGNAMLECRAAVDVLVPLYDFSFAAIYRHPEEHQDVLDFFCRDVGSPRYFE